MYSEEYEDEELEQQNNGNFISNFYYNNKVLVWIFIGIIGFIIVMSLLTGGGKSDTATEGNTKYTVVISSEEETIALGKSTDLTSYVKKGDRMDSQAKPTWSVEDETIATVSSNGNVVGVNYGKTKVIASYIDSNNEKHTAECVITVANGNPNTPLTSVSFPSGDLLMQPNSTQPIALVLNPTLGYVESETFTSSNPNVATVDNTGLITSINEGETTISFNVNNKFTGDMHVYVSQDYTRNEIVVLPTNISFDGELRKVKVGTSERLSYTLTPQNADISKLTWRSSDETKVTVDSQGYIKAIAEGSAVITVTSVNGQSDRIDVEVESDIVPVTDIIISVSDVYLTVGGQSQVLTPVISPDNASNKALSYSVADPSIAVASPSSTGTQVTLTAISVGSTTLTISSVDGVERNVNIIVTGSSSGGSSGGSSSGSSGGSSGDNQTIVVRSASNNLEKTYNDVLNKYAKGPSQVTITLHSGVAKVKYCLTSNYNVECNPNLELNGTGSITVPDGNIYLLCVKKYDRNGNELASSSANYSNGVLHYYINTLGNGGQSSTEYKITGTVYDTYSAALSNPYKSNVTLSFSTTSANGLKICYRKYASITNTCVTNVKNYAKTFSEDGAWVITISDPNTLKVLASKYIYINKSSNTTNVCCCTTNKSTCSMMNGCTSSQPLVMQGVTSESECKKKIDQGSTISATATPTTAPAATSAICNPPSSVSVTNSGKVSWTTVSGASKYQIQFDGSSWKDATNNSNYFNDITSRTGTRTVYVRSVCNGSVSVNSATTNVEVFSVSIAKGNGIDSVSGAGNYINGSTVSISAIVSTGYKWSGWTGSATSSSSTYSFTINGNKSFTANATLESSGGNGGSSGGTSNASITWSNHKNTIIYNSISAIYNNGVNNTATISGSKEISKILYCVYSSSVNCTINESSYSSYINREYKEWSSASQLISSGQCSNGDVGKTYIIDKNRSGFATGGISYSSDITKFTIPFCFDNGQGIKIKVFFNDGTSSGVSTKAFAR